MATQSVNERRTRGRREHRADLSSTISYFSDATDEITKEDRETETRRKSEREREREEKRERREGERERKLGRASSEIRETCERRLMIHQ